MHFNAEALNIVEYMYSASEYEDIFFAYGAVANTTIAVV